MHEPADRALVRPEAERGRLVPLKRLGLRERVAVPILLSVNNSWNIINFRSGLVRRLARAGYRVCVISPGDAHAGSLAELGVEHLRIDIDSKGISPIRDIQLFIRYWRVLRRHRPAAFLGWTIKPNIYGSMAAHLLGIPVINNVSGLGTAFITKGPLTRIVSVLYRLAFARSATIFFQNAKDRQLFVDLGLVKAKRTALLPGSGIDVDRFAPVDLPRRHGQPFAFLLIARLLRDKGVLEYVEAARRIRAECPGTRFAILGFMDAVNRTAITRYELTAWLDEGAVVYLGDTDDVRPHIAAADCVVLPSYREGMPRSLLEGAAMAKPLIATDVPGCTEIARDGQNAILCQPRDAGSLAEAMRRMLDLTDDERRAMGSAGRQIAVNEFAEHIIADRYLDALASALGGER